MKFSSINPRWRSNHQGNLRFQMSAVEVAGQRCEPRDELLHRRQGNRHVNIYLDVCFLVPRREQHAHHNCFLIVTCTNNWAIGVFPGDNAAARAAVAILTFVVPQGLAGHRFMRCLECCKHDLVQRNRHILESLVSFTANRDECDIWADNTAWNREIGAIIRRLDLGFRRISHLVLSSKLCQFFFVHFLLAQN